VLGFGPGKDVQEPEVNQPLGLYVGNNVDATAWGGLSGCGLLLFCYLSNLQL
jgi:hypothetical protein